MHVQQQKTWDESNKLNRLKNSFFLFYHSTVFTKRNSHFEDKINKNKNQRYKLHLLSKKDSKKNFKKTSENLRLCFFTDIWFSSTQALSYTDQ